MAPFVYFVHKVLIPPLQKVQVTFRGDKFLQLGSFFDPRACAKVSERANPHIHGKQLFSRPRSTSGTLKNTAIGDNPGTFVEMSGNSQRC